MNNCVKVYNLLLYNEIFHEKGYWSFIIYRLQDKYVWQIVKAKLLYFLLLKRKKVNVKDIIKISLYSVIVSQMLHLDVANALIFYTITVEIHKQ